MSSTIAPMTRTQAALGDLCRGIRILGYEGILVLGLSRNTGRSEIQELFKKVYEDV